MRRTLGFLGALLRTNLKASVALRGAFWVRVAFMFLNNFIFLVMWVLFFDRFEEIRGWRLADMAALFAVAAGSFGLAVVTGHGVHELSRLVATGDLDAYLSQPKSPLLRVVGSRSEAAGWGDLASGVVLFALCGLVTPATIPLCLVLIVSGAVIFLASGVLLHSLAFWMGDTSSFSRQAWNFLIFFSIYPQTVFGGWLKVLLFTVVPAGFLTYLPVELLREFRADVLAAVLGGSLLYAALAALVFHLGLRRYAG